MRKLVKEQMGKRLLNLVDELATSYGQGTFAHSNIINFANLFAYACSCVCVE